MEKVQQRKFILYNIQKPEIKENVIISCPGVGGVRLKCRIETSLAYKIRIPNWIYRNVKRLQNKKLRYFYIPTFNKSKKETKILYRPYKKNWDKHRNRLSYNKWGKKNHPLTNTWMELENETIQFKDLVIPIAKQEINDNLICKHLTQLKTFKLYN